MMEAFVRKAVFVVFLPFLLASSGGPAGQEKIGDTVFLEGDVGILRDGAALAADAVVIGAPIENFDLMKTGDDGSAQVTVNSPRAPASTVTVSPGTQFTFELSVLQGHTRSSINLISGSLSLKISKLGADQDMDVQTENTVLGVRGTEFSVSTSDAGDVLVTCSTGAVACAAENGTEYQAAPGTVVENQAEGAFRTIPVAATDLDTFRRTWAEQRRAAVRANALRLIQQNVARYQQLRAAFDRDYAALQRQQSVISRWMDQDRRGTMGNASELGREKTAVAGTILRLRRTQFLLERVYYRLLRLRRLHDEGYGRGSISASLTADQFFDQLQRERSGVELRMANVRYVVRLYARRNGGEDPTSYSLRFRPRERPVQEKQK